jgi:hypothetical protein
MGNPTYFHECGQLVEIGSTYPPSSYSNSIMWRQNGSTHEGLGNPFYSDSYNGRPLYIRFERPIRELVLYANLKSFEPTAYIRVYDGQGAQLIASACQIVSLRVAIS